MNLGVQELGSLGVEKLTELALGEIKGDPNVNILNSSLEQIVGLILACGLSSSLSGCLPEVEDLCSGLF